MNDEQPYLVAIPLDLDDEAAAQLLEFLYELVEALDSAYAGQLYRYYHRPDGKQHLEPEPERDPPF